MAEYVRLCFLILLVAALPCYSFINIDFLLQYIREQDDRSSAHNISPDAVVELSGLSDKDNFNQTLLAPIMKVRVPGTPAHDQVRQHICTYMRNLNWDVREDTFMDDTPLGSLPFTNIIATHQPNNPRRLTLACHYDSKYYTDHDFYGMSDSAVPCAMLLDLARTMTSYLNTAIDDIENSVSLQMLFLDGEEAFVQWTDSDSLYGSRRLAAQMEQNFERIWREERANDLQRMDMFILLDLIGAANPRFESWFDNTRGYYEKMQEIERRLMNLGQYTMSRRKRSVGQNLYFQTGARRNPGQYIQDDHVPFLEKGVPILHLISHPFPTVWHKPGDNYSAYEPISVDNINKVLRVFVAEYMKLHL